MGNKSDIDVQGDISKCYYKKYLFGLLNIIRQLKILIEI